MLDDLREAVDQAAADLNHVIRSSLPGADAIQIGDKIECLIRAHIALAIGELEFPQRDSQ